jgi:hypothetical protein
MNKNSDNKQQNFNPEQIGFEGLEFRILKLSFHTCFRKPLYM